MIDVPDPDYDRDDDPMPDWLELVLALVGIRDLLGMTL